MMIDLSPFFYSSRHRSSRLNDAERKERERVGESSSQESMAIPFSVAYNLFEIIIRVISLVEFVTYHWHQ
jgi:hypothetical protein